MVRSQGRKGIDHCAGTKQILDGVSSPWPVAAGRDHHGDAGAELRGYLPRAPPAQQPCVAQRSEEYGASLGYSVSGNLLGDLGRYVRYIHHRRDRSEDEPT